MNQAVTEHIENLTYDELRVGQSASLVRTLSLSDVQAFAALCGAPAQDEPEPAAQGRYQGVLAPAGWSGSLVSTLLGTALPGPGTVWLEQNLQYLLPVRVGDSLTVSATVSAKEDAGKRVHLDCKAVNQNGETVLAGRIVARAPTRKIVHPAAQPTPARRFDPHARLQALLDSVKHLEAVRCAVVHPCDAGSLKGALDAARSGLIAPVLVAPEAKLRAVAEAAGLDLSGVEILPVAHSNAAAEQAAALAAEGKVEALMKGSLHTDEMISAVLANRPLRTKRRLSHVFRFDIPTYDKPLLITDCALNIRPTLEEKADIIQNAISLAHALGVDNPKVAILSAVETVNVKLQSTLDAAALCKMADRGQITGGTLDGPLAFDNAVSPEAARIKGIRSEVAGQADILMVPDLESGNMLAKQLEYLAGATTCGVVLGARVPIALTSRADGPQARVASAALMLLMAHRNREIKP